MRRIGVWVAAAMAVLAVGACDRGGQAPPSAGETGKTGETAVVTAPGAVTPVPLPDSANFPVAEATINGWIAKSDTAAIRGHAWSLWQGMSAPSGQTFNGQALPIWETWAGPNEVFPSVQLAATAEGATLEARLAKPRVIRSFAPPLQFHHAKGARLGATAAFGNADVTADNKFNPQAATFIDAQQPGPNGGIYSYSSQAGLTKLNASWPAETTPQNRGINAFPVRAIETKPVFGTVQAAGLTIQPLWQGPSASTNPANPTVNTWTSCILISPTGTGPIRSATPAEIASVSTTGTACKTFQWAPLSTFYAVRLTADEAKSFAAATGKTVAEGDYAVLLAMHVNTKEIPFWTWQTFWWQPGADTPNNFPGNKQGQPSGLAAPWTNYAACTAYDQTTTPGGATMTVCFNPYLETDPGIPVGITSNCMSCHGVALVGPNPTYPAAYKKPIAFFTDPTYFDTKSTHTDFSWAVASSP
jgi:hypothetical protein